MLIIIAILRIPQIIITFVIQAVDYVKYNYIISYKLPSQNCDT